MRSNGSKRVLKRFSISTPNSPRAISKRFFFLLFGTQVIVTSYLFPSGKLSLDRLRSLLEKVGKDKLVIDISCRKREQGWVVAMNKWQDLTDTHVTRGKLKIASSCHSFVYESHF